MTLQYVTLISGLVIYVPRAQTRKSLSDYSMAILVIPVSLFYSTSWSSWRMPRRDWRSWDLWDRTSTPSRSKSSSWWTSRARWTLRWSRSRPSTGEQFSYAFTQMTWCLQLFVNEMVKISHLKWTIRGSYKTLLSNIQDKITMIRSFHSNPPVPQHFMGIEWRHSTSMKLSFRCV